MVRRDNARHRRRAKGFHGVTSRDGPDGAAPTPLLSCELLVDCVAVPTRGFCEGVMPRSPPTRCADRIALACLDGSIRRVGKAKRAHADAHRRGHGAKRAPLPTLLSASTPSDHEPGQGGAGFFDGAGFSLRTGKNIFFWRSAGGRKSSFFLFAPNR
jgi:hypothetical protein